MTLTLPRTWQGTAHLLLSPDDSRFKNAVNCPLGGQEGEQGHYTGLGVAVTQTGVTVIDVETIDDFSWIGPQVLGSVDLCPWRLTGQDRARTFTIGPTQSSGYDSAVPKAEWTSVTVTCDDGSVIEVPPCRPMPQAAQ